MVNMGRTQRQRVQRRKLLQGAPKTSNEFLPELFQYLRSMNWQNETQLVVHQFPYTGRGLCSKRRQFSAGDELIRLPLQCLVTIATLEADAAFKAQFDADQFSTDQRVPFQALMALYLLHQQHLKDKSKLRAYLHSLPQHFNTPYFCPVSELQCLPEVILEKTVAHNRRIRDSFLTLKAVFAAELCGCCGQQYFNAIYTLDDFKWAYFAVNSRSVYISSRQFKPQKCYFQALLSDDTNLALAPFLDMFNHSDKVVTSAELLFDSGQQPEFVLTLQQTPPHTTLISHRTQLFISYGALTNLKLLTEYGFVLPDNRHDYFEFSLLDIEHFIKQEKCFSERTFHRNKFKFIREHNLQDQMFVQLEDGLSHNLHVVLHLIIREERNFPNMLNQVAFGDVAQLQDVSAEVRLLLAYKIAEYQRFMADLGKLPALSMSGLVAVEYMQQSVWYLQKYLDMY